MNQINEIQDAVFNAISKAEQGEVSHLDTLIHLRQIRTALDDTLKAIKDYEGQYLEDIELAAKEYGGKYRGYEIEVRSGRRTWDYSNNPQWNEINQARKHLEEGLKAMFQAKLKGASFADVTEDGEQIVLPTIKYSRGSVIVKETRR